MLNLEIESKLKNLPNFLGVFARDTLPNNVDSFPHSLICNTDEHDEEGTHWIAIYVDKNMKGDYFDSYGRRPLNSEFLVYLQQTAQNGFKWNRTALQCDSCVTCGEYCCVYLIARTYDFSHDKFIKLFTKNLFNNDIIIKNIFNYIKWNNPKRYLKKFFNS